ncbi:hypothetical protein [Chryseolinea sp. H1M3-3]|uniref:hypothetical protein n=1 Tax=Chryseolinea sp. H1M3-3 TaxID=3034144 RepID=UPI0023ED34D8|nr:hypothetical protein [Chryseolinea sp. H1M3-3]
MIIHLITILLFANCIFSVSANAQNFPTPKKGFFIVADDSVVIEKGTLKKINVSVLRAKGLSNENVRMETTSFLPDGVEISFAPERGDIDLSEAIIAVAPSTKVGSYFIVLSGTLQYKTKGRVIKLVVTDNATVNASGH